MKSKLKPKFDTKGGMATVFAAVVLAFVGVAPSFADPVIGGAFLPSFNGTEAADLVVQSGNATVEGSELFLTATLAGPTSETLNAVYVYGFDRGQGTSKFANIGEGNVLFDSTVALNPTTDTVIVKDLVNNTTETLKNSVNVSGNTISSEVSLALLPSEGLSANDYEYALWPESGAPNAGNTEISEFAPNNADAQVSSAPEPGSMTLLGAGLCAISAAFRRRRSQVT